MSIFNGTFVTQTGENAAYVSGRTDHVYYQRINGGYYCCNNGNGNNN
jgi:hypothetical protein